MAVFYQPIFTRTLTSTSALTFNNIPQVFTDLELRICGQTAYTIGGADGYVYFQDGFSTTNYSSTTLQGQGSGTPGSYRYTNNGTMSVFNMLGTATANMPASIRFLFPNYTSSTWKTVIADSVAENNASLVLDSLCAGTWRNTSAITQINITIADAFVAGTEFTLYGISR